MGKSIVVASKFTEEELDRLDWYVKHNNTTRSALFHDLVINGLARKATEFDIPDNVQDVTVYFKEDYAFFWKDKTYKGRIYGDDITIYFGGEWKQYKLKDLPIEIQ